LNKLCISLLFLSNFIICHLSSIDKKTIITPHKKIDIQKVMNYPMDEQIKRYIKDYKVDYATAKKHEQELKRWFIIGQELDKSIDMYSSEIDNFWHTLLLYTKNYAQFCNDCFGQFIHHDPKPLT